MRPAGIPERRKAQRQPIFLEGTISFASRTRLKCLVQNLSETGAKLAFKAVTDAPAEFTLNIFLGSKEARYLARRRWRRHRLVGVEFVRQPMTNVVWLQDYVQT